MPWYSALGKCLVWVKTIDSDQKQTNLGSRKVHLFCVGEDQNCQLNKTDKSRPTVFAWEELCYLSSPGHISQSISHRSEVDRVWICERPEKNRHRSVAIDTDLQNNSLDLSLLIGTIERVQSRSDLLNWWRLPLLSFRWWTSRWVSTFFGRRRMRSFGRSHWLIWEGARGRQVLLLHSHHDTVIPGVIHCYSICASPLSPASHTACQAAYQYRRGLAVYGNMPMWGLKGLDPRIETSHVHGVACQFMD